MENNVSEEEYKFNLQKVSKHKHERLLNLFTSRGKITSNYDYEKDIDHQDKKHKLSCSSDTDLHLQLTNQDHKDIIEHKDTETLIINNETYCLASLQQLIKQHYDRLDAEDAFFANFNFFKNKSFISSIASHLNFINSKKLQCNSNTLFSYQEVFDKYDQSEKLVDEYGRVFFHIPILSNSSILRSQYFNLKYGCDYLLPIYRKWLSGLVSYEVEIIDGKPNFIKNLGNRSFIYGDTEYIEQQKKYITDYKTSPDNFHVVMDKDKRVYFSEVPKGMCPELESKRIIENLDHTSTPMFMRPSFHESLFFEFIESIIIDYKKFFNDYNTEFDKSMVEYNPRFLYCQNYGLPLLFHTPQKDSDESFLPDILFNTRNFNIKETKLFFDQKTFDQVAFETNLLSQQKVLDNIGFYNKNHKKFHCDFVQIKNEQLQDYTLERQKFWNLHLADSLYLQTDAVKDILVSFNQRKIQLSQRITKSRDSLCSTINYYLNTIFPYCHYEETSNYYKYFTRTNSVLFDESKQNKKHIIINRIEKILQNTLFDNLKKELPTHYKKIVNLTCNLTSIDQKYQLSRILENNPKLNLLELVSYSVLSYLVNIAENEFYDSFENTRVMLEREIFFIEKSLENFCESTKPNITKKVFSNPGYVLLSSDLAKLNLYMLDFFRSDISQIRRYKYIVLRLYDIEKSFYQDNTTLLNKEVSKRIRDLIQFYSDKIKDLEKEVIDNRFKKETYNLPYKIKDQEAIGEKILKLEIKSELEDLCCFKKEIDTQEIFKRSEQQRVKEYKNFFESIKNKNTLVIYNHASEIDKTKMSRESCNELDNKLIKPGYSYCYHRSLENFYGSYSTIEKVHNAILNNDNIHIVGVNDGTADAQYILGFIVDILHQNYDAGRYYNGEIFIELYNPVGISKKIASEIDSSIKTLKTENLLVVNIINETSNKSLAVGNCLGIDFGISKLNSKSSFFVRQSFLNSLDNYLGYEFPHYCKINLEDAFYFKLKPNILEKDEGKLKTNTWQEYKKTIWGLDDIYVPTVHCMKRIAGLKNVSESDDNIFKQLHEDILYDENLYQIFLNKEAGDHYQLKEIENYLMYSPFFQDKIKIFDKIKTINS